MATATVCSAQLVCGPQECAGGGGKLHIGDEQPSHSVHPHSRAGVRRPGDARRGETAVLRHARLCSLGMGVGGILLLVPYDGKCRKRSEALCTGAKQGALPIFPVAGLAVEKMDVKKDSRRVCGHRGEMVHENNETARVEWCLCIEATKGALWKAAGSCVGLPQVQLGLARTRLSHIRLCIGLSSMC